LEVPIVTDSRPATITLEAGEKKLELPAVSLPKPRKWTVYLVQHVHTDIGYTRPQTEILPEHLRYIDYALDYCDLTDDYPDDARFRWTCEISWAVREYLRRRPPEQVARLKRRIAEGRIEVAGMFLNMSELATESAMAASLQPIREIEEGIGAVIRTAMQDDVNGAAWCLPDFFDGIGLKYLIMGSNKTRSLLPFDQPTPFWWESPSGKRILALRADHYHTGNFWKIHTGDLDLFRSGLLDYLASLEARAYPFDEVSVQYSGYHTDNSPPAKVECDLIRAWNEKYAWPKLRSAVAGEFPQSIVRQHAEDLSVHRQAWPDWWTDGFGSAARETAAARQTHTAMDVNQTLLAMARLFGATLSPGAAERATSIQENLLFYDEHTYGAAESISDPMAENSQVQWGEKSAYVWEAVKQAALLREEALGALQPLLPRTSVPTIAIFNTLAWNRSGLVELFVDHEILPADRPARIVDPTTGQVVPAQRLRNRSEGSYWALWVTDIPPLGYKAYRVEASDPRQSSASSTERGADILENAYFQIRVDPKTGGVTDLVDKQTGLQLVDHKAPWQLGQLLHESLKDRRDLNPDRIEREAMGNVQVHRGTSGPIWQSLLIRGDLDGCAATNGASAEIRLYEQEKRIEFHYAVRKLPIPRPEGIYVAFPFALPDGTIHYEAQGGVVEPGRDQLAGTSSDWQTVQNFLAVRSPQGQIVWGSDQVPLVQLGELNLGKWQPVTQIAKPHVYSWVMNNYWFTNFRATQEGEFKWSYYLTCTDNRGDTAATRFGWGSRVPLVARVLPPGTATGAPPVRSALDLKSPDLLLVSARPSRDADGVVLHLRELAGRQTTLDLSPASLPANIRAVEEVNVIEKRVAASTRSPVFSPHEVKFIKLTVTDEHVARSVDHGSNP
ncbi:MAG: glycoside hydrolase family 38 C-terminal domain-containing protein, partial [Pirellulales bacterium]